MYRLDVQNLRALQMWLEHVHIENERRDEILRYIVEQLRARGPCDRTCWVAPWMTYADKVAKGAYHTLVHELEMRDVPAFIRYLRFEPEMFREMEGRLYDRIVKKDTPMRKALEPAEKIAITLRYLATGETFRSLAFQFRVGNNTVAQLIPEICEAIIAEYEPEVMPHHMQPEHWLQVAADFERLWNFPHALGALDGKHVAIQCPPHSGSHYYNYKRFYSIILLAMVDAKYRFMYVDIGANGACSDTTVFAQSDLKEGLEQGQANLPPPSALPNTDIELPYFIIGDDAFALKNWLMKPYSRRDLDREERIFNYRLSRARRVVENAFGILVRRFRCLLDTIELSPAKAATITYTCVLLHNLMRLRYPCMQRGFGDRLHDDGRVIPGDWRNRRNLIGGQNLPGGNYGTQQARDIREELKDYFNSPQGAVVWQDDMI